MLASRPRTAGVLAAPADQRHAVVCGACYYPTASTGNRFQHPTSMRRRSVVAQSKRHEEESKLHESKLGPGVVYTKQGMHDSLLWGSATVIRNDAASLDGSVRLLHLAVSDKVDVLYGRKLTAGVQGGPRWIDNYTLPGQSVGVRLPSSGETVPKRLYTIASSPYASRRDSAYINASIIEVVVQRGASPEEDALVGLGPGAELEVSQVIGRGFASLLNSYGTITSAIEEKRNLILVGVGTRGITAMRAVLNWQPVLAHAAGHRVSAVYVARCPAQAAFVPEWDSWREAGVYFQPLYTDPTATMDVDDLLVADPDTNGSPSSSSSSAPSTSSGSLSSMNGDSSHEVHELLEDALFYGDGGLERLAGGKASECFVLLAGLPTSVAPKIAKELHAHKVEHERMLFCDYF